MLGYLVADYNLQVSRQPSNQLQIHIFCCVKTTKWQRRPHMTLVSVGFFMRKKGNRHERH